MTEIDEQGRPEPPLAAAELATLLGFLEFQRATFRWKTDGLDAAGLNVSVAASTMTLGGLLKHLSFVEDYWFSVRLFDRRPHPPWDSPEADDPEWEWHSAADDPPELLRQQWRETVERSRARVTEAMSGDGLDMVTIRPRSNGESSSLRWILVHMIEEYARHNGHADFIREQIDGQTGE
ncbi:DinB family protein [Stackebrandtia endophytica]|uniref:DinB family protein n=1 Tax=Stackebrandtia endophytica TaxID=1496996 RepID=UPI00115051C8|nr:DinB family protein [Stackebrandtia endophytica]